MLTCQLMLRAALSLLLLLSPLRAGEADGVDGTLILANENAGWCWYQDEKILHDPANGTLHFSTTANRSGFRGPARNGDIDHVSVDFDTRERTRFVLDNLPYVDGKGDDHNMGALWIRPDGRYLHVWTGHNNDHFTRYRISEHPHDATSWRPLQRYNWEEIAGRPSNRKFTYSNVHFLSAERDGKGRLYNIGRGDQNSSNISYSDDHGETWRYAGKLTTWNGSSPSSYSNGYFKYNSNGIDRIDFISTEHHPRNFNNGVYHGYLEGGKTYNSFGEVIDDDIFDEEAPDPKDFTPLFQPAPRDGVNDDSEHHTAWTIELERTAAGHPVALYTTRYGTEKAGHGDHPGAADHRIFYARFDGKSWHSTELGKMGGPLLGSEQDYVGLGAIHPNNPDYLVLSTPFDPADGRKLGNHELFEGRTSDQGRSWSWTRLTFDSTVDNLRPAIPAWDAGHTAIFWMRGIYRHQSDFDQALVGILRAPSEAAGKTTYLDVTPETATVTGNWTYRADYGNGGTAYECIDPAEAEPADLTVTFTAPAKATYDLFAWFWSPTDQDWRLAAGLSPESLRVFRRSNSQQPPADRFTQSIQTQEDDRSLYQAYLGRRVLDEGETVTFHFAGVPGASAGPPQALQPRRHRLPDRPLSGAREPSQPVRLPIHVAALLLAIFRQVPGHPPIEPTRRTASRA